MRELTTTMGEQRLTLIANFRTSKQIAAQIDDPLMIVREISMSTVMAENRIPYTPKFQFTIDNIADFIYIGVKEGDAAVTLEQIQELVFEHGFFNSQAIATDFLSIIVGPKSEEPSDDVAGKDAPGK